MSSGRGGGRAGVKPPRPEGRISGESERGEDEI